MDAADDAKPTAVWITSARVTVEDRVFLDREEYARCAGRWCHTVCSEHGEAGGSLFHEFIAPSYEEAATFAIAMAREHRCVIRDHSQVEP